MGCVRVLDKCVEQEEDPGRIEPLEKGEMQNGNVPRGTTRARERGR
jgi:hypothetical protein